MKILTRHQKQLLTALLSGPVFRCKAGWKRRGDYSIYRVATADRLVASGLAAELHGAPGLRLVATCEGAAIARDLIKSGGK